MQEMQDLNEKLRDPNNVNRRRHHRQIEQKQEANVAVLKNTNSAEMNKIKDRLQINRFNASIVLTQQVNELIILCVSCSPKVTSGHLLLIEVVEMTLTQMGFILYV